MGAVKGFIIISLFVFKSRRRGTGLLEAPGPGAGECSASFTRTEQARSRPQTAGCRQSGSWHQQRVPGQQCLQDRARRCAAELAQLAGGVRGGVRGGGAYRSRRQRHAAAVRQQRDGATAARREAFACLKACGQPGRQASRHAGGQVGGQMRRSLEGLVSASRKAAQAAKATTAAARPTTKVTLAPSEVASALLPAT